METKKKTKSKFCNKKTIIDFVLNMTAVCLGVLLAFFLQDCWYKSVDANKTEKVLFMTYYETLYNVGVFNELYSTYSNATSTTINLKTISTNYANELLFQSNKNDFVSYIDVAVIYNYIELAKIVNENIDDYYNYMIQTNFKNSPQNKIFREKITEFLIEFCAETKFVQDMTVQYDIERNIYYKLKVEVYKEKKENYIKAIQQGKLDVDIK